jgi:sporulation protein YlmC with PRC-barrel domain
MAGHYARIGHELEVAMSIEIHHQPATNVVPLDNDGDWSEQLKRAHGFRVVDHEGTVAGELEDLFVEPATGRVRFLRLKQGGVLGFGKVHLLVPVEEVTEVGNGEVFVDLNAERLIGKPSYFSLGQPRFDIHERTPVVTADGKELGRVLEIHPGFLVVEHGMYFPHYFYLPNDAIAIYDGQKVHLNQTRHEARDLGWDKAPPTLAHAARPIFRSAVST